MAVISLTNPLVQSYIVYSAILALKLLIMSTLTGLTRLSRGVFANPEDGKKLNGKVKFDDPIVERTRRAHLNDLENIPAFWVIAALYLTTGPAVAWATLLFRVYTVGRIVHTLVYAFVPFPQPTRGIAYMIPYAIMWYMGLQGVCVADVERIRRAHLNDLENIPVFWLIGALYLTNPSDEVSTTLFRVYTAGRILHTVVYAVKTLPQPARAISFEVPYFITIFMGVRIVTHYVNYL